MGLALLAGTIPATALAQLRATPRKGKIFCAFIKTSRKKPARRFQCYDFPTENVHLANAVSPSMEIVTEAQMKIVAVGATISA
jgi:hypothetical protein